MKTLTAKDAKYAFDRLVNFAGAEPLAVEALERLKALNCASGRHGGESEGEGVTMERGRSRKTPSDNDASRTATTTRGCTGKVADGRS